MAKNRDLFYLGDVNLESLFNIIGWEEGAKRIVNKELVLVPNPEKLKVEPELDFCIYVDRSAIPNYPKWVYKLMHPRIEFTGLPFYNLKTHVEEWLSGGQKSGVVKGHVVYNRLKEGKMIETCLSLSDLEAIRSKGVEVFRYLYAGKTVYGWKSVVSTSDNDLSVPYLYERDGEVVILWKWLGDNWSSRNPALRFRD